jgi:DNA replication protein DnaC
MAICIFVINAERQEIDMKHINDVGWLEQMKQTDDYKKAVLRNKKKESCSMCGGVGVIHVINVVGTVMGCVECEEGKKYHENYQAQMRKHINLKLGEFLKTVSFDSFRQRKKGKRVAIELAEEFSRKRYDAFSKDSVSRILRKDLKFDPPAGLYVCGELGTGKTALMMAAAYDLIRRYTPPYIIHGRYTIKRLAQLFWNDPEQYKAEYQKIEGAEILMVDDFNGGVSPSASILDEAGKIIDSFYVSEKPIFITSNIMPDDLEKYWGSYIASRLSSMCLAIPMRGVLRKEMKLIEAE